MAAAADRHGRQTVSAETIIAEREKCMELIGVQIAEMQEQCTHRETLGELKNGIDFLRHLYGRIDCMDAQLRRMGHVSTEP